MLESSDDYSIYREGNVPAQEFVWTGLARLVFWEPMVSPHKWEFFAAIKRISSLELTCYADANISLERKGMGWSVQKSAEFEVRLAPSASDIRAEVLSSASNTLHIFSGLRWVRTIEEALLAVRHFGAPYALMSEPRAREGLVGALRLAHSILTERRHRRDVQFILAQGRHGPPWFRSVGYSEEKIFPFAYFVDPPERPLCELRQVHGSSSKERTKVGYIGRLVKDKGIYDLVAAIGQINSKAQLSIIGDGPEAEDLKAACEAEGVLHEFMGALPRIRVYEVLGGLDVLVLPSTKKDGWGVVVSEALMCGVPVVATTCVGASVVLSGIMGEEVPPNRPEEIALAVLRVATCDSPAKRVARAARAKAMLSADAGAKHFIEIVNWRFNNGPRPKPFYDV